MTIDDQWTRLGRRAFLRHGTLLLAVSAGVDASAQGTNAWRTKVRFGMLTDLHHADKPPAGTRYYRETLGKLAEAAEQFQRDQAAFIVELGDLIDAADSVDTELRYLETVNRPYAAICDDRHYVLGNHCVDTLTKEEFLGGAS
jgi:hypothetical protein